MKTGLGNLMGHVIKQYILKYGNGMNGNILILKAEIKDIDCTQCYCITFITEPSESLSFNIQYQHFKMTNIQQTSSSVRPSVCLLQSVNKKTPFIWCLLDSSFVCVICFGRAQSHTHTHSAHIFVSLTVGLCLSTELGVHL